MEAELEKLLKQKQEIEEKIQTHYRKFYNKYEEQKDKVTSENPYSRLFALKKMGIVQNYEQFSQKSILIVGNLNYSKIILKESEE
jgi:ubiquitin-like modifier-activating enzyme 5